MKQEITRQCYALPPSLLKRDAASPRSFGYALARKGQGRRLRLAQNDKVNLIRQRFALPASPIGEAFVRRVAPRSFGKLRMTR
jgi:hypothetical protein